MEILIGLGQDETTKTLRKFRILDETISGKFVITPLRMLRDASGKPYLASAELYLRPKEEITDIHYEVIED